MKSSAAPGLRPSGLFGSPASATQFHLESDWVPCPRLDGSPCPTGTEGAAVVQFEVPAIVPADPDANVADLLVKRVEAT
ncbi:hypothetical protein, partial [Microbacterium sp. H6]|uniref:hypothetical protein n=1 Tax=Microbacterium sp. H6 TaxID=421122 RepID=UPI00215D9625